ncbi:hypothetical protein [Paenibacillus lentus]|uniref:Nucleotidyltransferase family protein n=1 Tax=Paenibacillus lentus TaxID=1338368 RepID=A0A3Q8S551_9BACL|nr:hypothetical protein [Paenibacillus lentus]AZK47164.1 hypothetical protein EIM92_14155 [Paenibacillus lentus]
MSMEIAEEGHLPIVAALKELSTRLAQAQSTWLLGGSCGLWLQGVPLERPPRDIDVYYDRADVKKLHASLTALALDEPILDESGSYTSMLSHYRLGSLTMELVGGFEVKKGNSKYRTEVNGVLSEYSKCITLGGSAIQIMPLVHELLFNVLRERPDRYNAIAEVIRQSPEPHLSLLKMLLARNKWDAETVISVAELLDTPEIAEDWESKRKTLEEPKWS